MFIISQNQEVTEIKMSRTFLGKPLYFCHAFLIDGLLVDTGLIHEEKRFDRFLKTSNINQAVITHHHEDHTGNLHLLNRMGIIPYAHYKAIKPVKEGFYLYPYQKYLWGVPYKAAVKPVVEIIETDKFKFKAIETPGHSDDHIVLLNENNGWLFGGDFYLSSRLQYLRNDEDLNSMIASTEKVLKYDFEIIFDGLKGAVNSGKTRVLQKLNWLYDVKGEVLRLAEQGIDADQIAKIVFQKDGIFAIFTQKHFSKKYFVTSILKSVNPVRKLGRRFKTPPKL